MKTRLAVLALAIVGMTWHGPWTTTKAEAETITIRADSWCPYNCEPESSRPGFMIEIAQEVFSAEGIEVDYELVNWSRAVKMARFGKITAVVGATRDDAKGFVFPRREQGLATNAFYVRADDDWRYTGPSSLGGRRVGTIQGYDYGKISEILKTHGTVDEASGDSALKLNFRKLVRGRIDALVEDANVADLALTNLGMDGKIQKAGASDDSVRLYIAFSPKFSESERYAKVLSDGMAELRENGRLDEILAKYGISDWR